MITARVSDPVTIATTIATTSAAIDALSARSPTRSACAGAARASYSFSDSNALPPDAYQGWGSLVGTYLPCDLGPLFEHRAAFQKRESP